MLLFEEDEEELPLVSCASPVAICVRMCAFWSGVRSMECKDAPHAEHRHSVSDDDDDDDEEEAEVAFVVLIEQGKEVAAEASRASSST